MADLGSLMQVAPYAGGFMAGQRNTSALATDDMERQKLAALIQGINQQNQQSQAMNPLLVEQQKLHNQGLEAGLPGITADSRTKVAQADFKEKTLKSEIEAAIAKADGDRAKAVVDVNTAVGQMFGRAGAYLNTIPNDSPGRRAMALQEYMAKQGLPADHPMVQQLMTRFSQIPSDKLPGALEAYGNKILQDNSRFQEHKYSVDQAREGHREITGMNNQTQKDLEQMRIEAGKYKKTDRSSFESYFSGLKNARDKHAALIDEATKAQRGGDMAAASNFMARAEALRPQAEAEIGRMPRAGSVDTGAVAGVPTNPTPSIAPPGQGGPAPANQAQAVPPQAVDFLRKNPGLRAQFDAKYGAGAADRALQGK